MIDLDGVNPLIKEWIERGLQDLSLARLGLDNEEHSDAVAVLFQQGAEKIIKAALLTTGWKLRKIHDLEQLIFELSRHLPQCSEFLDLGRILTSFFEEFRYPPGSKIDLTIDDMHHYYDEIKRMTDLLIQFIKSYQPIR